MEHTEEKTPNHIENYASQRKKNIPIRDESLPLDANAFFNMSQTEALELAKKYINPLITDKELAVFLSLCKQHKLNPLLRDVYCIKYSPTSQASFVISYEVYLRRAWESGKLLDVEVKTFFREGEEKDKRTPVSCSVTGHRLVGDREREFSLTTYYNEVQNASTTKPNFWNKAPIMMLQKVAVVRALRYHLTDVLGGLPYVEEEIRDAV